MNKKLFSFAVIATCLAAATSCKKDTVAPTVVASDGKDTTLNLLAGAETGANAANSMFVDFSTDKLTVSGRADWDLAFNAGTDFRVLLNYKTSAAAKELTKNDLTLVGAADTVGLSLTYATFAAANFALTDSLSGSVTQSLIKEVSATATDNKVYIIQRGIGSGIAARPWYKVRIIRNASGGYTLQYARITETTFKSIDIAKDATYNFAFVSFDNGIVQSEPKKAEWDIQYTAALYQTLYGTFYIPYPFSDMVLINYLGGTTVSEVLTTTYAYDAITLANAKTLTFSNDRWSISDKWRTATSVASPSVKTDRFYVVKDAAGNYYKLKFISFHNAEGGVRGKPVIEYKLLK